MTKRSNEERYDKNWCDWHNRVDTSLLEEHCAIGEHCTSTDASCAASMHVDDHGQKCCICEETVYS